MANEIWYGDPGLEPDNKTIFPPRWQQRWAQNVSYPLGGSPTNMQFTGGLQPGWASGEVDVGEGLLGPWLQERAAFMGGLRYGGEQQPNVGQFGVVPANVSTPALPSQQVRYRQGGSFSGDDRYDPAAPRGVPYSPPHSLQLGTGVGYQPPGQAPAGGEGGRFEFTYQNIQDLERGLKEAGYTGQTIYKDGDVIRRDGQGRILSITRGAGSRREISTNRLGYQPAKHRRWWDRAWNRSTNREGTPDRNKYATPDWIKTMSNWRGI